MAGYQYDATPSLGTGYGAFGGVPGQIALPSPYSDLSNVYPNLSGTNKQVGNVISGQLAGQLSPETQSALQNYEAAYGASAGMPGSNAIPGSLTNFRGARDLGTSIEALQQKGVSNYNQTIPTISSTQTLSPAIEAEIANINSINAAAPNPDLRAVWLDQEQQKAYEQSFGPLGEVGAGVGQGLGMLGSVVGIAGAAGVCWVARAVYGADNPNWLKFRKWMMFQSPLRLFKFYVRYGERIARFVINKPILKFVIRKWMDTKIG